MKIFVCIDDTDNKETRGTGWLAEEIAADITRRGWGSSSFITRHQLYVHPDVPYTSHNSAMCFAADVAPDSLEEIIGYASGQLVEKSAPGSDPGLCVAVVEKVTGNHELMSYGTSAKSSVLTKDDAYSLAGRLGVHLSEHGGTGQGVVGALAGVALRLGGNDGRIKGKIVLGGPGASVDVRFIMKCGLVDAVRTISGFAVGLDEEVVLGEKVKTVFLSGMRVLLLTHSDGADGPRWRTCTRQELGGF